MDAWLAFIESHRRLFDQLDRELRSLHDLTFDDYDVLHRLSVADGGQLRMTELADRVVMPKSRITYRVDQLESRGLIRRNPCADDRRGIAATITEDGRRLLAESASTHVAGVRRYLLDLTSDEELEVIARVLGRVRDLLSVNRASGSPEAAA